MKIRFNVITLLLFIVIGISSFMAGFYLPFLIDPISRFSGVRVGKENLPGVYIVQSGSMEPAVKTGSLVLTLPNEIYKKGDIITFSKNGSKKNIVTHRIVSEELSSLEGGLVLFTTEGDANTEVDSVKVMESEIIGRVYLSVPYIGYLANYAKGPKGFIFFVIVPATIVIYEEFKFLLREIKKLLFKIIFNIRKKEVVVDSQKKYSLPKAAVFLPLTGAALFLIAFSSAYFFDREKSIHNSLGASNYFEDEITLPISDTFSASSVDDEGEFTEDEVMENGSEKPFVTSTITLDTDDIVSPTPEPIFEGKEI